MNEVLITVLNPGVTFFVLGVFAALIRSNLEVPESVVSFITLYLMLSIGFSGGINLYTSEFGSAGVGAVISVLLISAIVPIYTRYILTPKVGKINAAAIGATYGSNSTLTYITATGFVMNAGLVYSGFMTFALAVMELPAIIFAVLMTGKNKDDLSAVIKRSLSDGTLIVLLASMLISYTLMAIGNDEKILGKFISGDVFTGFLMFFLLYMGLRVGKEIREINSFPKTLILFALIAPFCNGILGLGLGYLFGLSQTDTFLLVMLCASSSYIVAPALLKELLPEAEPSKYLTMSLGITFPINVVVGIPFYFYLTERVIG